jgi:hypothetical protein
VPRREKSDTQPDADVEALSITRLEGSRWRGGRAMEPQVRIFCKPFSWKALVIGVANGRSEPDRHSGARGLASLGRGTGPP